MSRPLHRFAVPLPREERGRIRGGGPLGEAQAWVPGFAALPRPEDDNNGALRLAPSVTLRHLPRFAGEDQSVPSPVTSGMMSMPSPGKMAKCGWFSKSLAAASTLSAVTTR